MPRDTYSMLLAELLEKARDVIALYYNVVEPLMEHPRHRENLCGCICDYDLCSSTILNIRYLMGEIEGGRVCVVGPLASDLSLKDCDVIGAPEGGIPALLIYGLKPHYVTSDLDLNPLFKPILFETPRFLLIHIHGDNFAAVYESLSKISVDKRVIVTTQVETCGCSVPLGGYTDGDRAVLTPLIMGADEVRVYGYSFDAVTTIHKSLGRDAGFKKSKLSIAKILLTEAPRALGYSIIKSDEVLVIRRSRVR